MTSEPTPSGSTETIPHRALLTITGWPTPTETGVRVMGLNLKTSWRPQAPGRFTFRIFPRSTPDGAPISLHVAGVPRPAREHNGSALSVIGTLVRHDRAEHTLTVRVSPRNDSTPAFTLTMMASDAALAISQSARSVEISGRLMAVRERSRVIWRLYAETANEVNAPPPERWIGHKPMREERRKARLAARALPYPYHTRWRDLTPAQREELLTPPNGFPPVLGLLRQALLRRAQADDLDPVNKEALSHHLFQPSGLLRLNHCLWSPDLKYDENPEVTAQLKLREQELNPNHNFMGMNGSATLNPRWPQRLDLSRFQRPSDREAIIIPDHLAPQALLEPLNLAPLTDDIAAQLFGIRQPDNARRLRTLDHYARRATQLSALDLHLLSLLNHATLWTILKTALPHSHGRIVRLGAAPEGLAEAATQLSRLLTGGLPSTQRVSHAPEYLGALHLLGAFSDPGQEALKAMEATFGHLHAQVSLGVVTTQPSEELGSHLRTLFDSAHSVRDEDTVISATEEGRAVLTPWQANLNGRALIVVSDPAGHAQVRGYVFHMDSRAPEHTSPQIAPVPDAGTPYTA